MRQRKSVLKFTHALNPETKSRMPNCLFWCNLQECLNKSQIKKIDHYPKWLIVLKSVGDDYLWPQLLVYSIDFVSCHFWECWDWISDWISSSLTFGSLEKIYRNCLGEFITVWWQFSHIKTHKTKIINRFQNHPEPSLSPAPALDRPKTAEFYFPERDLGILLAGFLSG